jgi:DNA-binding transcriptional LysR family regulator
MERSAWLGVELRHLAAFEAVAREGSFRRAAIKLGYGQSAISQQIAALEKAVGERLIERSPGLGGLSLTHAGELLLEHAGAILKRLQAAEADLTAGEAHRSHELRVGVTEAAAVRLLPEAAHRFRARCPEVRLSPAIESLDLPLYAAVAQGDLDLAFGELPAPEGPFETVSLMSDPYVLLIARAVVPAGAVDSLREIGSLPLIGNPACRGLQRAIEQLRALGGKPSLDVHSDVDAVTRALVRGGFGAAVMPGLALTADDPLTLKHVLTELPPRVVAIVRNRDRRRTASEAAFIDAALEVCAQLAAGTQLRSVDASR